LAAGTWMDRTCLSDMFFTETGLGDERAGRGESNITNRGPLKRRETGQTMDRDNSSWGVGYVACPNIELDMLFAVHEFLRRAGFRATPKDCADGPNKGLSVFALLDFCLLLV